MGSIVAVFPLEVSTMKTLLYLSSLVWTSLANNFSATLQVNEYGVLYNQTQVFDPSTGDMIVHVPSHFRNGTFFHDLTKVENENLDITVLERCSTPVFLNFFENRYLVPLRLPCGLVIVDYFLNISDYMLFDIFYLSPC